MKLYFVRHGQSQANVEEVYAGTSDSPLTQKGRLNAEQAAAEARSLGIKSILSSDLSRAFDTAAIIAAGIGIDKDEIVREPRLREVDVGKLTGQPQPSSGNTAVPSYADYCREKNNQMGVEYLGDTVKKMRGLLADMHNFSSPILLVGHDMSGRVLKQVAAGLEAEPTRLTSIPNAKIIELEVAGE